MNNGNLPFCLKITNWPINFKYRDPDYQVQLFKTAFETEDAESVLTAIIQAAKATGHDWPLIALNKKSSEWIQQVQSDKGLPRNYMTTAIIKYGGDEGFSKEFYDAFYKAGLYTKERQSSTSVHENTNQQVLLDTAGKDGDTLELALHEWCGYTYNSVNSTKSNSLFLNTLSKVVKIQYNV